MNRKQMIETIAKEAGCSKRLVRKKLFARCAEIKRLYPDILFEKEFLNKDADWQPFRPTKDWRRKYTFDVFFLPSGCVVLFRNVDRIYDAETVQTEIGTRLYNFKHIHD